MALKTGISGLRGTVAAGETSLTATAAVQWVQAFVGQVRTHGVPRPTIALGHDARCSSPALAALVRGALLLAGAEVLDLGLTLTPTLQLAVHQQAEVAAGIMITASHNPVIWNGLKFVDSQGFFIPLSWWDAMHSAIERNDLPAAPLDRLCSVRDGAEVAWERHLRATLNALPVHLIQRKGYRVALDACNGGAARWAELLRALGCEPFVVHTEMQGVFAREAEPLPAHLDTLRHLVRSAHCDLGLAADPDGDRLVLVDARGEAVHEEYTVVLAAMGLARRTGDTVVVNVVTTHALEELLPRAKIIRTAVGEMNVVQAIQNHHALVGGEGSGGIIIPRINLARDGMAAAGTILGLMAERDAPLHDLIAQIPPWHSVKSKLTASTGSTDALRALFAHWHEGIPEATLAGRTLTLRGPDERLSLELHPDDQLTLTAEFPNGERLHAEGAAPGLETLFVTLYDHRDQIALDLTDGVKLHCAGAWLSLRPSNTEPIVRVMGEGRAGR